MVHKGLSKTKDPCKLFLVTGHNWIRTYMFSSNIICMPSFKSDHVATMKETVVPRELSFVSSVTE